MVDLRKIGCCVILLMNLCNDHALLWVNSLLNLSPRTYAMLFFSGSGGTAAAWYSL